jgi:hypothetical protein
MAALSRDEITAVGNTVLLGDKMKWVINEVVDLNADGWDVGWWWWDIMDRLLWDDW